MPFEVRLLKSLGILMQYGMIIMLYIFLARVVLLMYKEWQYLGQPLFEMGILPEACKAELIVEDKEKPQEQRTHIQLSESTIIGRGEHCDIVRDDQFMSYEHACIVQQNHLFILVDLQSTNGTYLNSKLITQDTVLRDDDLIRIGSVVFRFKLRGDKSDSLL